MSVTRRRSPPASTFLPDVGRSYYWDSYEAPLLRDELAMHEIYLALFAHPPRWFRQLLILRDHMVAPFRLQPSGAADHKTIETKPTYAVGEKIVRFTLFGQNDDEIVTGGDGNHLDCRVPGRRLTEVGATRVALTTMVSPHNFFGRAYLFII